jgi:8-oxo-dGTP pyrophosphatase MutT (NUDIX family)
MFKSFKPLNRKITSRIVKLVRSCQRRNIRKATVAILLRHGKTRKFLVIVPSKTRASGPGKNPGLVKGGIRKNEHVLVAGWREIEEELGIPQWRISFRAYGGSKRVRSLRRLRGFSEKQYFLFYAVYDGPLKISINRKELSDYRWLKLGEIKRFLAELKKTNSEKYVALTSAFEMFAR